jgi:2-iminobutanoate/2-iminopropanoate deaminase
MKDVVLTERGPKPIGPYSQAIKSGGFLFASGQVALDPRSNEFLAGDIRQQTERVLENVKAILEAGGANLHHVVKTTVFLKDMNDFAAMNEVYGKYFSAAPPARSTVQVARLPKTLSSKLKSLRHYDQVLGGRSASAAKCDSPAQRGKAR